MTGTEAQLARISYARKVKAQRLADLKSRNEQMVDQVAKLHLKHLGADLAPPSSVLADLIRIAEPQQTETNQKGD